jgi:hypothetical protein
MSPKPPQSLSSYFEFVGDHYGQIFGLRCMTWTSRHLRTAANVLLSASTDATENTRHRGDRGNYVFSYKCLNSIVR